MTNLRKAAEMALEALDCIYSPLHIREIDKVGAAMAALRQALAQPEQEYVIDCPRCGHCCPNVDAVNISQERVDETAKREHEPVACKHSRYSVDAHEQIGHCYDCGAEGRMRFVVDDAPPKREWIGLTDGEIDTLANDHLVSVQEYIGMGEYISSIDGEAEFARAIEAKLKEKNT